MRQLEETEIPARGAMTCGFERIMQATISSNIYILDYLLSGCLYPVFILKAAVRRTWFQWSCPTQGQHYLIGVSAAAFKVGLQRPLAGLFVGLLTVGLLVGMSPAGHAEKGCSLKAYIHGGFRPAAPISYLPNTGPEADWSDSGECTVGDIAHKASPRGVESVKYELNRRTTETRP